MPLIAADLLTTSPWPAPLLLAAGLHTFDYVIVALYLAVMLAIGGYLSRRQHSIEEFSVGGRHMPWWAVGMSMIATMMSTISYLGTPGEMIKHGAAQMTALLGHPIAWLIVTFLWVPFFMRLKLTSAYEYLEKRFGSGTRQLAVGLYLYMRFVWMGLIVATASQAIAVMTKDTAPQALSMLSGGLIELDSTQWFYTVLIGTGVISTLYTMLGGIQAVIWTDVMQFIVLFGGAVMTLIMVAWKTSTGPATWWSEATQSAHEFPPLISWNLAERNTVLWAVLSGVMWNVCTHCSDQVALQRYFTTRSVRSARRVAAVNYLLDGTMLCLLSFVGMALLSYYMRNPEYLPSGVTDARAQGFTDQIFPHFIVGGLPIGISGLVLAGVFAVAQSSLDSGINSTATVVLVDIIRWQRGDKLPPERELRMVRVLTVLIGFGVTLTGLGVTMLPERYNILDLTLRAQNVVLGPLGGIFMAGILLPHVAGRAATWAGVIGAVSGVWLAFGDMIGNFPVPSSYLVTPLAWLVTFLSAALLGALDKQPSSRRTRGLTRQSVMRAAARKSQP